MTGDTSARRDGTRSLWSDRRGTTAVEFAFVGLALVGLLFCIVDFAWQLTIDTALSIGGVVGARFGTTGTGAGNGSQQASIVSSVISASGGLMQSSQLTVSEQSYASAAAYAGGASPTGGAGTTGQFVVYTLTYNQAFLTGLAAKIVGLSSITHQATVAVQNEPY